MKITKSQLRKIIKEEIIKEILIYDIDSVSLVEVRSLMNNTRGKLPDFLYRPLEDVIRESRFWFAPNTEDKSDMNKTSGGWQNQTQAAIILQSTIQDFLNFNDIKVSVAVITPQADDNPELRLPITKDHKLYPNRLVFIGSQDVSDNGRFVMFMLMAPVDENFEPRDVDPVTISRIIGKIVRHELIHVIQLEKRRRNQRSSRLFAKDEFAKEGEIVDDEDRSGYLRSRIEIDAYAHEFAEELLQKYGKDKSLNILRGLVPIESLDLSDQFREYLENIPGEESSIILKKKMYSHIVDLASREIYEAKKKKKKKKSKKYVEKTYKLGTKKTLDLDKPTSHGGWPEGPSRSFMSNKPVNVQISNWLKGMSMMSESPEYFGSGFSKFKNLVDGGESAEIAAEKSGFKLIKKRPEGATRRVYEHPSLEGFVLKIAHGGRSDFGEDSGDIELARRTNREEAQSGRDTQHNIFPKVYPGDERGDWILSERVVGFETPQEMSRFFPEIDLQRKKLMWWIYLEMGAEYSQEMNDIYSGNSPNTETVKFNEKIKKYNSSGQTGRGMVEKFSELWKNPNFRKLSAAIADYGIAPSEVRHDNTGFVVRDGRAQFVILDVSVGIE